MLDLTPLLRGYFSSRARRALRLHDDMERTQRRVLAWLIERGARTDFGRRHGLHRGMSAAEYAASVPLQGYPDVRDDVMRALRGERDVLWPGRVSRFAQSSGTTDGKSKYIPVTDDSLTHNHYRGGVQRGSPPALHPRLAPFQRQDIHPRRQFRQRSPGSSRRGEGG